ncbi:unnamed protein product [Clonostachys chloroleuca]|uniref:Uncharacterized protein n=1 Tax=Clonostachys chloroleuca TaxID=1926264 RepID=A0AA35PZX0_9HYPO|nr:unnamed protein product [Clonostachys chloroleuca]
MDWHRSLYRKQANLYVSLLKAEVVEVVEAEEEAEEEEEEEEEEALDGENRGGHVGPIDY